MPLTVTEIPNIEENIARPVAMEIARDISKRIGLPEDIDIRFIGSGKSLSIIGSTLQGRKTQRLPGDSFISLEVSEEYDSERGLNVAIFQTENRPVVADTKLGLYVKPVYQRVYNDIKFKIVAADKTTADNIVSTIKRRHAQRAVELLHEINYSWPLPTVYMVIINEIYKLREANKGYGETVGEWINKCFTEAKTVIVDQSGNNPKITIREKQINVLGWFDFEEQPPQPQRETESGTWSLEFTYRVGYDRIESAVMSYPMMVHNQVLPDIFYETTTYNVNDLRRYLRYYAESIQAMHTIEGYSSGIETAIKVDAISIPHYDDWVPTVVPPRYKNIARILLQVDPNNPHAILSLTNLGAWSLPNDLLEYLKASYFTQKAITVPLQSIINIQLYRGSNLMNPNDFIISPELDIHYARPLDEREVYHLAINMLIDIRSLNILTLPLLAKYGEFLKLYLSAIYPSLANLPISEGPLFDSYGNLIRWPVIDEQGFMSVAELGKVLEKIPPVQTGGGSITGNLSSREYALRLVSYIFIVAQEMQNANS